jgi:hypothetical protein
MELNDFEYLKNSPFKMRKFKILPLTHEGVDFYNTKESYSHKYLNSMRHLRLNDKQKIFPEVTKENKKEMKADIQNENEKNKEKTTSSIM